MKDMSFIRATEEGEWEDIERGLYVYQSKSMIHGVPTNPKDFVEVVMRMLDQTDELEEEELERVHSALRARLRIEREEEIDVPNVFKAPSTEYEEEEFDKFLDDFEGAFEEDPKNYD